MIRQADETPAPTVTDQAAPSPSASEAPEPASPTTSEAPAPAPTVTETVTETVVVQSEAPAACGTQSDPCRVRPVDGVSDVFYVSIALVVLLLAGLLAAQLRRPR